MYFKAIVMIVFVAGLGAGMLSLRQSRWQLRHETARMHQQIEQNRRTTWGSQAKVAAELHTDRLAHKIAVAQIDLEPITASSDPTLRRTRVTEKALPPAKSKSKSPPVKTKTKTKRT